MYPVTQAFKDAIYAPSRSIVGQVTFDISDTTAAGDVSSIVTTTEFVVSNKAQLIDKNRNASLNLGTLETNRFKLDGAFSFADSTIANNGEVGFTSNNLCASNGVFATSPTITFNFGTIHSSVGLTLTFDRFNNEYATDFNISAYNAAGTLITSVNVTGNTQALVSPIGLLLNYKKVVITITKWSVGDRRARMLEVDFGVVRIYTDDTLISMGMVEEMDLTSSKLPSPEFKFTVDNSDKAFNILNPTGFYKYLQQRQQVLAEIGVDIGNGVFEFVPLGSYLLWEWQSDEGSLTATFTVRTNLDLMANYEYENLTASSKTLYQFAVDMFTLCGITNYSIDPALAGITTNLTPTGYLPSKTWITGKGFDNTDANRLEGNIKLLMDYGFLVYDSFKICGTFYAGEDGLIY